MNKQRFNDTHKFDTVLEKMSKVETLGTPPSERTYHTASIIGSFMIIIGGESFTDLNDVFMLDLDSYLWTKVEIQANESFHPRRFHTSTVINTPKFTKLYVYGGCYGEYHYIDDMQELTFDNLLKSYWNNWKEKIQIWKRNNQQLDSNKLEFQQILFQQWKSLGYFENYELQSNQSIDDLIKNLLKE